MEIIGMATMQILFKKKIKNEADKKKNSVWEKNKIQTIKNISPIIIILQISKSK
jgi:hypothetical protein